MDNDEGEREEDNLLDAEEDIEDVEEGLATDAPVTTGWEIDMGELYS